MLALVSDSTNAVREGVSPSEGEVAVVLERLIAEAPHRVAVTTFASNVARLRAVAAAAQRAGRDVVIVGRAIRRAVDVARELGYLEGLPPVPRPGRLRLPAAQQGRGADDRQPGRAARGACRASPPATIARWRSSPGDRVIFSSRTIPGNERAVNTIINALVDFGAEVITDRDALVHTSGHPRRDELRQLYDWTKPQIVVPVHGEALHLHEQAKLARAAGVAAGDRGPQRPHGPACAGPRRAPRQRHARPALSRRAAARLARGERRRRAAAAGFAGVVSVAIVLSDSGDVLEDPTIVAARRARRPTRKASACRRSSRRRSTRRSMRCRSRAGAMPGWCARRCGARCAPTIDTAWGKKPQTIVHVTHVSD